MVVATSRPNELLARAHEAAVTATVLGTAAGSRLVVEGLVDLALDEVAGAWSSRLPRALETPAAAV